MVGGAIPPARAVPSSTRVSERLKRIQEHSSPVRMTPSVYSGLQLFVVKSLSIPAIVAEESSKKKLSSQLFLFLKKRTNVRTKRPRSQAQKWGAKLATAKRAHLCYNPVPVTQDFCLQFGTIASLPNTVNTGNTREYRDLKFQLSTMASHMCVTRRTSTDKRILPAPVEWHHQPVLGSLLG